MSAKMYISDAQRSKNLSKKNIFFLLKYTKTYFYVKAKKMFTFCVKLIDPIFFLLCHSPIFNLI